MASRLHGKRKSSIGTDTVAQMRILRSDLPAGRHHDSCWRGSAAHVVCCAKAHRQGCAHTHVPWTQACSTAWTHHRWTLSGTQRAPHCSRPDCGKRAAAAAAAWQCGSATRCASPGRVVPWRPTCGACDGQRQQQGRRRTGCRASSRGHRGRPWQPQWLLAHSIYAAGPWLCTQR
jgi:hypothetical protein